jgi:hypothetical protein
VSHRGARRARRDSGRAARGRFRGAPRRVSWSGFRNPARHPPDHIRSSSGTLSRFTGFPPQYAFPRSISSRPGRLRRIHSRKIRGLPDVVPAAAVEGMETPELGFRGWIRSYSGMIRMGMVFLRGLRKIVVCKLKKQYIVIIMIVTFASPFSSPAPGHPPEWPAESGAPGAPGVSSRRPDRPVHSPGWDRAGEQGTVLNRDAPEDVMRSGAAGRKESI